MEHQRTHVTTDQVAVFTTSVTVIFMFVCLIHKRAVLRVSQARFTGLVKTIKDFSEN